MSKLYFSFRKYLFDSKPQIFRIYKRYLEENENISFVGKIKSYAFLSKIVIKNQMHFSMKKEMNIYDPNVYYLKCRHMGKLNSNKVLYVVERDESGEGFIAILRTLLYATVFADCFNLLPVLTISKNSRYYQSGGWNGITNPFEYFFVQPAGVSLEVALHSDKVVRFKEHHLGIVKDFPIENPYHHGKDFVEFCSKYFKKYFILKDDINNKINNDINSIINNKKVLGVHFRGGDFAKNYDKHPKMVSIEDYFEVIDKTIKEYNYSKIFVATDDVKSLKKLKNRYKELVICYSDVLRTNNSESVMNLESKRKNNQFLIGYEVLRDMYTLASCDSIISGVSMVNIFARIAKKSMGKDFVFDMYIDKGVNNNLKSYNDVRNRIIKNQK